MKFYKLTNDLIFKALFTKEKNIDLLEELLVIVHMTIIMEHIIIEFITMLG